MSNLTPPALGPGLGGVAATGGACKGAPIKRLLARERVRSCEGKGCRIHPMEAWNGGGRGGGGEEGGREEEGLSRCVGEEGMDCSGV